MGGTVGKWDLDPSGRHEYRWWDGVEWTEHVSTNGVMSIAPLQPPPPPPVLDGPPPPANRPAPQDAAPPTPGQRAKQAVSSPQQNAPSQLTIFNATEIVSRQRSMGVKGGRVYDLFDTTGFGLGAVHQAVESQGKMGVRRLLGGEEYAAHQINIYGSDGALLLRVDRPSSKLATPPLTITDRSGEIGLVVEESGGRKPKFSLRVASTTEAVALVSDQRRRQVIVVDRNGIELGRADKAGKSLTKALFGSKTDDYLLSVSSSVVEPLRSVILGFLLTTDLIVEIESS